MLALASMQIEPNLRPHQAMDWALHKRWIDLDASGRAAIAAAIAANCSINPLPAELEGLASPKLLSEATSWGYAVRLFRRLGANSINSFNGTALTRNKGKLCLLVADSMQSLQSRGTSKDLDRLASSLGIESEIQVVPDHELAARRFPSVAVTAHEPAE
jgi:exopolyphosphatase/guanosine-5'-triphosphate,3'-diphosphate pyrophosphatase